MKKVKMLLYVYGILSVVNLYGCSYGKRQTMSENEAEIELSLEKSEDDEDIKNTKFSEGDLVTMFEEVNNESVVEILYDDYNKDGVYEAFVLTEDETYKLWYISPDGCEIVQENLTEVDDSDFDILSFRTKDYILLQQKAEEGKNTLVYSIDNHNRVVEADISRKGYFYRNEAGELLLQAAGNANDGIGTRNGQMERQKRHIN